MPEKSFANDAEVMAYYKEDTDNNQVVIFEGVVYNVKEYAPDHPGGSDYLTDNLGINIEELFEEHEHTKAARKTLYKLPIVGRLGDAAQSSDSDKQGVDENGKVTKANHKVENLFDEKFSSEVIFDYDAPLLE